MATAATFESAATSGARAPEHVVPPAPSAEANQAEKDEKHKRKQRCAAYGICCVAVMVVIIGLGAGFGLSGGGASSATQPTTPLPSSPLELFPNRVDASLTFSRVNITALRASPAALSDLRGAIAAAVGAPVNTVRIAAVLDTSTSSAAVSTRVDFSIITNIAGTAIVDTSFAASVANALSAPSIIVSALGGFMATYGSSLGASVADVSLQGITTFSVFTPLPSPTSTSSATVSSSVTPSGTSSSSPTSSVTLSFTLSSSVTGSSSPSITASISPTSSVSPSSSVTPSVTPSSSITGSSSPSITASVSPTSSVSPSSSVTRSVTPSSSITGSSSPSITTSVSPTSSVSPSSSVTRSSTPSSSITGSSSASMSVSVSPSVSPPPRVMTLAGGGSAGGNSLGSADGVGTAATFYFPHGSCADGSGNLYIADRFNNLVRKMVLASATVSTLAGVTTSGSTNGIGTQARFNRPCGVAHDGVDKLFVADSINNQIRVIVISSATVSTLAGSTASGSADGVGIAARFTGPRGVAYSSGILYVADSDNNMIRQILVTSATVTTLAGRTASGTADGTGTAATFLVPNGIFVSDGNLYIADTGNHLIRQMVITSRIVTRLAGSSSSSATDGVGTAASFYSPYAVTGDGAGNLYVTDTFNHRFRKIEVSSRTVTTVAGSTSGFVEGPISSAQFYSPFHATFADGKLYATDSGNNVIRVIPL